MCLLFIVDRYIRLKFRRSKCGNTHIQSNISACEKLYIFSSAATLEKNSSKL